MVIDKESSILRMGAKLWLNSIIEDEGIYDLLNNFIENDFINFIDKEIILQVGGIIQKGSDLCLDGFFGIELFPKNSNIEKFSIEGKIVKIKNERKLYALGIIIALTIIPENTKVDLKTDEKILKWSIDYSRIGSTRRELDDPCYIFLNCINTMLDLKGIKFLINDKNGEITEMMKEVKLPALKKELIRNKHSIEEVVIKYHNIIIDKYTLRRKTWGIKNDKCPRCILEIEYWDHIWSCEKNGPNNKENVLFRESVEEFSRVKYNVFREVTRGIINEKWLKICTKALFKAILRDIFDLYMVKLQKCIWEERCNETIEIEKQMGLFKELKRKKRIDTNDSADDDDDISNNKNYNNKNDKKKIKKIKNIIKIDLENSVKEDVFCLGSSNRHRIGNNIISNLVNT
ncbi:hypothetical protein GLOIN_2v1474693 [Rhizophagus irregularis DAOM 181602=DAOM 197198]|uniref:Uncharacterized protein n=2 Tax=Rhizophagus irregularis TaxID=588596 RepID=A0A2P4QFA6_RHIID|nr:hypothetical protein GLOIN_2v1474693 [Rhizophagus irregularis DAOM 181602=DAOM 197198]POG76321.1 hypothetical protein GLOIN_2v1474693 [Rhizophagus irregularis DAOM 181602=DAOM 197198]|eukprot:XP_025183187.1 hypothetical protein GLOIN_2v1474693 [Rhizophagus irregularis DAOM 181602=DAOM 197198]